jgi:Tol biopolymer transport system component
MPIAARAAGVAAGIAVWMLTACEAPEPPAAAQVPAQAPPATAPIPPYGLAVPVTEPVAFAPGIISTGDFESGTAFSPDGRTLYFVKSDWRLGRWTIYESHYADGHWGTPVIAPFSGKFRDADPFVTADGRQLYFISDRPVDGRIKPDMDIWVMDRAMQGWSEPRNLGAPVNSPQSEWHPSMSTRGVLYFGSSRPGGFGLTDLYRATSGGGEWHVENLGAPVNTPSDEYEPLIAPDGSYLIFMAYRPDALGGSDLYASRPLGDSWTVPVNLGAPVNSAALEMAPSLSPDGKYLFYTSTRRFESDANTMTPPGNGNGDLYEIDRPPLPPVEPGK